jgi:hypothetical protein
MDGGDGNIKKSNTIDSASLSGNGSLKSKKTRNKTARKIRPSSIVQPSVLKKTLLERIKQHQRTRERSREKDDDHLAGTSTGTGTGTGLNNQSSNNNSNETRLGGESFTTNFSQSMDFLQKLALKRQQQTNRTRRNTPSGPLTSSEMSNSANSKTPEAKMLNQVAETLTNGEIITNTGIVGLPVNAYKETIINNPITAAAAASFAPAFAPAPAPMVHIQAAFPSVNNNNNNNNDYDNTIPSFAQNAVSQINTNITPNITDLANMYNSTFASGVAAVTDANSTQSPGDSSAQSTDKSNPDNYPIHVPEDPESFLPSIFIKEEPPHGCLKQGNKPTFREWANKMLKKPADAIKNIFGGSSSSNSSGGTEDSISTNSGNTGTGTGTPGINNLSTGGSSNINPEDITGMRVKIRKTLKKKYRVGKHDNVVGVLLKNKESQRHIQKQHLTLKQKPIGDIRKHLYEKNLLKIGSNAPPDVLRRLYEDSILTGDVKNTNNGVLVHNFFSNE